MNLAVLSFTIDIALLIPDGGGNISPSVYKHCPTDGRRRRLGRFMNLWWERNSSDYGCHVK